MVSPQGGNPVTTIGFDGLLKVLAVTRDEFISIGYDDPSWDTAVLPSWQAPAYVAQLPDTANIFFGVCPTRGPARVGGRRGTEADITRLSALWADLDVKPGACHDLGVAYEIIGDLTGVLGTRPSAVVLTGHGVHPYWPVADGQIGSGDVGPARALITRWGRLVAAAAANHHAAVDDRLSVVVVFASES